MADQGVYINGGQSSNLCAMGCHGWNDVRSHYPGPKVTPFPGFILHPEKDCGFARFHVERGHAIKLTGYNLNCKDRLKVYRYADVCRMFEDQPYCLFGRVLEMGANCGDTIYISQTGKYELRWECGDGEVPLVEKTNVKKEEAYNWERQLSAYCK